MWQWARTHKTKTLKLKQLRWNLAIINFIIYMFFSYCGISKKTPVTCPPGVVIMFLCPLAHLLITLHDLLVAAAPHYKPFFCQMALFFQDPLSVLSTCLPTCLFPVVTFWLTVGFFSLLASLQYSFCHIKCLPTSSCLMSAKLGSKVHFHFWWDVVFFAFSWS